MKQHPAPFSLRLMTALGALVFAAFSLPAAAEESLGRLFFTPERRQTLDQQRQFNIQEKQEIPEDPTLTINGVVTRSSGKRTVWVNGVAVSESDPATGVEVIPMYRTPGRVVIHTTEMPPAAAKVGNTVHFDSGENTDLLRGGRIVVRPQKSAP